jgi:hypothetical protein
VRGDLYEEVEEAGRGEAREERDEKDWVVGGGRVRRGLGEAWDARCGAAAATRGGGEDDGVGGEDRACMAAEGVVPSEVGEAIREGDGEGEGRTLGVLGVSGGEGGAGGGAVRRVRKPLMPRDTLPAMQRPRGEQGPQEGEEREKQH